MTDAELAAYYANLLIIQYKGKPNAYATIQALSGLAIVNQLPIHIRDAFSMDAAVGVQLEVLGKYAGVSKSGNGFTGPITLADSDFRTLIQLAVIKNSMDSDLQTIQNLLDLYFSGVIVAYDHLGMRMSFLINSTISTDLLELFVTEGLLPKPMGVGMAVVYAPVINRFFGFSSASSGISGNNEPFNTVTDYQNTWPWLSSHTDGVTP